MSESYPKSWWYPLAAVFSVIAGVNFFFLYLAITQPDYSIDAQAYEKGLEYETTLEEFRRAASSGFEPKLSTQFIEGKGYVLMASLANSSNWPESIRAEVKFLGDKLEEKEFNLRREDSESVEGKLLYLAESTLAELGRYRIDLTLSLAGEKLRHREMFLVKE